ncbi:MAG: HD domain-containing protein [Anaerolineaceae bacterium]|nr:HD domain-containing protein [Anaerolineaceae bacterium]
MEFIKQVNTPKRLAHALGVMQVMGELAEVYQLDREKAQTIGILHDAGKDLSPAVQRQLMAEGKIEIRHECETDYVYYLHGPVGSYFVQKELGITDQLILDAITHHTYCGNGDNFTHPMCWCLRFSDILEPTRNWSDCPWLTIGVENLRSIVYQGRLAEGAFLHTSMLIKWFNERNVPVHPSMSRVNQELSTQLNLGNEYLRKQINSGSAN